jgi:homeobox-leucine zipper protein
MMSVALHLPVFHFPIWFATDVLRSFSNSERP